MDAESPVWHGYSTTTRPTPISFHPPKYFRLYQQLISEFKEEKESAYGEKKTRLAIWRPEIQSYLYYQLALNPWECHLTSLVIHGGRKQLLN